MSYVELCTMPIFQKSTYLDSPNLINFPLSTDFNASLPQIGWYKTRLRISIGNFGELPGLAFHNLIEGPFIELQTRSAGETLYYIIGQLNESTKNLKIFISVCPINVSKPSFKQPRT
jgi:hypothetical protein